MVAEKFMELCLLGQSIIERGFFMNKEILLENLKSLR